MKIKRGKIIFLGILTIVLIASILFLIKFPPINIYKDAMVTIVEGADGPTTIYIRTTLFDWPIVLMDTLLLIILNIIILTVINIIENVKTKKIKLIYKTIIIFMINVIGSILFLPTVALISIILSFIIIISLFIKNKLIKKG